jgi:hypothetical protein
VVGAGARLIDIYAKTASAGAGVPGGSCATVGIAGLALGGGIGVMSRVWGLTCDDLLAAEVVTADGRVLTCDEQREPDLFWALRGGGGSFGVVTSLTLRTHAASALALGFLSWPWSAANAVIAAWQDWMAQAPGALWSNLHLDADRSGAQLTLYAVHSGTIASLGVQLDRLDALSGVRANRSVGSRSFMDTMLVDAGCLGRTVSQCHLAGDTPDGALQRETYAAKSIVATAPLSTATIAALTDGLVGPIDDLRRARRRRRAPRRGRDRVPAPRGGRRAAARAVVGCGRVRRADTVPRVPRPGPHARRTRRVRQLRRPRPRGLAAGVLRRELRAAAACEARV